MERADLSDMSTHASPTTHAADSLPRRPRSPDPLRRGVPRLPRRARRGQLAHHRGRAQGARLHLRPDVRHARPRPPGDPRRDAGRRRPRGAPVQRLPLERRHRACARADGAVARAARPRDVPLHRRRGERGRAAAREAQHRRPRGARVRGLVARHDRGRRVEHLQRRPARLRPVAARHDGAADAEPLPLPDRPLPRPLRPHLPRHGPRASATPNPSAHPPPRSSSRS